MRILITGASRGIGLGLVQHYVAQGHEVFAGMRRKASMDALDALQDRVHFIELDVSQAASVQAMAAQLAGKPLDLLFNNAGLGEFSESLADLNFASGQQVMEVNAFGPLRVAQALEPHIRRPGGKVVNMTSRMGSIGDNTSGGAMFYRMSKAALNMASQNLAIAWRAVGIAVVAVHPGWVQTDMGGRGAHTSVAESVAGIARVVETLDIKTTGQFVDYRGQALPW